MAYRALYRTWRPARFSDVVGQEPITRVLAGQIQSGKIAHAYLFSGPRGTGKTSLAKIFARAVNCQNRQGAEACGECESCRATSEEGSVDVVEIDAASNTGVDNIRDIRDRVNLLPAYCKYKVYIIDEVHMLSKGAFNALLKTLEEPPAHVIFILATTEPHKLPATILSRCQRFDFQRISTTAIQGRLAQVAKAEGFAFEEGALKAIARAAEGGMRDALSIMDQCAAFGDITMANVTAALGSSDFQQLYALAACIAEYDEKGALTRLRALLNAGADTRALIKDLADVFRRMMWLAAGADADDEGMDLKALAQRYGKAACIRALNILIQKEYEMRQNLRADIVLETAVMALMAPEDDISASATARIEKLEARLRALEERPAAAELAPTAEHPPAASKPKPRTARTAPPQPSAISDTQADTLWEKTLLALQDKKAYHICTYAKKAQSVACVDDVFEIRFDSSNETAAEFFKEQGQIALARALSEEAGRPLTIKVFREHAPQADCADTNITEIFGTDNIEIIQED